MDFFKSQDVARRKTSLLIGYYIAAVALIIGGVYVAFAATFIGVGTGSPGDAAVAAHRLWNPELFLWVAGGTSLVVLAGSLYKISRLSGGGASVAQMLGGRPLSPNTQDANERRILNVVEEMALASGMAVPRVFLLQGEDGINAFAAGFTPGDAVIGVTAGCIRQLSRDELQGVVAHEFSHIFNGDMRLNIRLIGVLNGILVIAIAGYWLMRSTLGSSSGGSRSKGRNNTLPIAALGVILMAVGYIGVFFGKLIKSAVSRQREYLADASAVQFTRHPDGLAGALKKIGGYAAGSRLRTSHAEEASHLFFANGLAHAFVNLMATHPPLPERIRRLDPSFDGDFSKVGPSAHRPDPGVPVQEIRAEAAPAFAADPNDVTDRVGAPRLEHLAYAHRLVDNLPVPLVQSAREPYGARSVVYGLLLSRDPRMRKVQLKHLAEHADPQVRGETVALLAMVDALAPEARLPLMELAMPALKDLSPAQYESFTAHVDTLVDADAHVDLFEFTLQRMLAHHLEPTFHPTRPATVQYYSIKPLLPKCAELLSCVAYWGADDRAAAEAAFRQGTAQLPSDPPLALAPLESAGLAMLAEALDALVSAAAPIKKQVLRAVTASIGTDGRMTAEEAELLRAIADSLDCPIPPFLPEREAQTRGP